ncbi:hypothetical protein LUZ61_018321 [Rhynchospora tenuis]|uniref:AAA+ ATPase domain-containing protein n=1 Tax=Rhynchospora tenuis TaxID=198213 RepID=A0AAD5Z922_9POAL|nr:hypothetical protein LUZ61_018321 [Rhynchospora tenuis]
MRRRMRRGSGRSSSPGLSGVSRLLRQRFIESGLDASLDAESIAKKLQSRYPEYRRVKLRVFSQQVGQVLASLHGPPNTPVTSEDNTSWDSDNSDENHPSKSGEESYGSQSTSPSGENGFDSEAACDVTKTLLRDSYKHKSTLTKPVNIEIDLATAKHKMAAMNRGPMSEGGVNNVHNGNSSGQVGKNKRLRFADLGGMQGVIKLLRHKVFLPLRYPELPKLFDFERIGGLLLHGPPGCGKTTLAQAIANEAGVPFYKIFAPEVVSGISGASEENIRTLFDKAYRTAPSIVFIDEIDAITPKRENLQGRGVELRIVSQLMKCMDQFYKAEQDQGPYFSQDKPPGYVLVIAATNRPDAIDKALRRPGRFDCEIELGVPDEASRFEILSKLNKRRRLEEKVELSKIARSTAGFVGADLKDLVNESGILAMERTVEKMISIDNMEDWPSQLPWDKAEMESFCFTMAEFEDAAKIVQPSLRREGFSSIPDVTWDDVGGLNLIKEVFVDDIVERIKHPEDYEEMRIRMKAGILLFGPPGCGKTLIAQAVANEAGANFILIKGPELLSKYVGESESEVRKLFMRARVNAPCVIFFDEVHALTARGGNEGGAVVERVLAQLLIELDGVVSREGVYVIGATNRIELIDEALLRPGRFDKTIYVPLPSADERVAILTTHARNRTIDADVDLDALARSDKCKNLSGSDLASLMEEAAKLAIKERRQLGNKTSLSIKASHLELALSQIKPSVSDEKIKYYEALSNKNRVMR